VILEREEQLATLNLLLDDAASSGGRVVLVRGEAGIGKSALVGSFLDDSRERAHTLLGACDDLITPQPFGPIWDIARQDASLVDPLATGDRRAIMEATLDLLSRSLRPTVLVFEDTQWADEATLDLIKFLGRRIARTNGLLILTYRDVEVDTDHALRQVVGDLPLANLMRMPLSHLSGEAVASMIKDDSFDVDEVIALTGGNPLFVTEVLVSGTDAVPSSIKDAVLARASKLSPEPGVCSTLYPLSLEKSRDRSSTRFSNQLPVSWSSAKGRGYFGPATRHCPSLTTSSVGQSNLHFHHLSSGR
jgi:hypothetical protein